MQLYRVKLIETNPANVGHLLVAVVDVVVELRCQQYCSDYKP